MAKKQITKRRKNADAAARRASEAAAAAAEVAVKPAASPAAATEVAEESAPAPAAAAEIAEESAPALAAAAEVAVEPAASPAAATEVAEESAPAPAAAAEIARESAEALSSAGRSRRRATTELRGPERTVATAPRFTAYKSQANQAVRASTWHPFAIFLAVFAVFAPFAAMAASPSLRAMVFHEEHPEVEAAGGAARTALDAAYVAGRKKIAESAARRSAYAATLVVEQLARRHAQALSEEPAPGAHVVVVEAGQDWQTLQYRFGKSGTQLAELNPNLDLNNLRPGQRVVVGTEIQKASSLGSANRGHLVAGVQMPEGRFWRIREPLKAWGTELTVRSIRDAYNDLGETFSLRDPIVIGDLSTRFGGRLSPHKSHRTGRDADIAYISMSRQLCPGCATAAGGGNSTQFHVQRAEDLDVAKQWHLFRYWISRDLVTYIFVDRRLIRALKTHAMARGESQEILEKAFGESTGLIRHEPGHDDHFHVRFRCETADYACIE